MLKKWAPLLVAMIVGIILAFFAITPPSPKGLDTPADHFSSARAMKDVRIIAAKPHPTGSEENRIVRDYLTARLEDLDGEVKIESSLLGERALTRLNQWSGETKTTQEIHNVIGVFSGEDRSKPALLLMAHHDTVWDSPGAADDTIGIASILEIIRALKEDGAFGRDLIVLFPDAEEVGLSGAVDFFSNSPLRDTVGAVINFEARGGGGTVNLFQTSRKNGMAVQLFACHVKQPSASSLSTYVYNVLPNDTDLTPALEKDYIAYNIANIGGAEYYHSPKIDADALDEATLQHMGSQGLDLTRALLSAESLPEKKADATFFDLFGFFTLIYPPILGWVFLAIAGILYFFSINRDAPRRALWVGALKMLGFLFIGGILLYGLNMVSGGGAGSNYYDRLAAITKLEALALFFCLAMFFMFFGQKRLPENERFGTALPLFVIALAGQAYAPTASYFLVLPMMLCAGGTFLKQKWPDNKWANGVIILTAAIMLGYMMALGHLLMQGVGPDMLSVAILPAAIAVLSILPLYPGVSKSNWRVMMLAGFGLAIAMALWIRLDPIAVTVPTY